MTHDMNNQLLTARDKIKDIDAIPEDLADLVARPLNNDHAAFKKLDELYIHTSHCKFVLAHLGKTIGIASAENGFRLRFPNRPEQAIAAAAEKERSTK